MIFHPTDVFVLVSYFVVIIGIGVYANRKMKGVDDYYMGGRRFGKVMMTMYSFGAGTHADSAVGLVSQTYKLGMAGLWYQWLQIFNTPFYWLLVPIFRRSRCTTTAEVFALRYGRSLGLLYSCFGIVINIAFMALMILGSGQLIEALSGGTIKFVWAVIFIPGTFLIYSIMGGMLAAVWNDFFQGILTIVMSLLLIPFLLKALGGAEGVRNMAAGSEHLFALVAPGEIGYYWIITAAVNQLFSVVAQPHIMSCTAAGTTELDNRIGFCLGITLKRLCAIAWALTGALAVLYYGSGKMAGDHVFGALIRDVLPVGFVGLMLACVFASVMDNGAAFILSSSALFTRNLLSIAGHDALGGKREIMISRVFAVIFVLVSVVLSLTFTDVPSAIRFLWALIPPIGISFWLGVWWRKANRYGAWASFLTALAAWAVGSLWFGWTGDKGLPYLITFYLSAGVTAGVIVSLLTPSEPEPALNRFFGLINTPISTEEAINPNATASVKLAPDYPRLVRWRSWEVPRPDKQAVIGFLIFLGAALMLHFGVLWICRYFES